MYVDVATCLLSYAKRFKIFAWYSKRFLSLNAFSSCKFIARLFLRDGRRVVYFATMSSYGRQPGPLTMQHIQNNSQNSYPPLSQLQPGGARPLNTQPAQPLRPFSTLMHSSSLTLSQSQQYQAYQSNHGGVSKPFSQVVRPGSSSMQVATAGQAVQQQQAHGLRQMSTTPPSQNHVYCSQPSQILESEHLVLGGGTQQPQPTIPSAAAGRPFLQQQPLGLRPGSSNSFGELPVPAKPGNFPASAALQKHAPYSSTSLGRALGQELEGRRVLEAVEAVQVLA